MYAYFGIMLVLLGLIIGSMFVLSNHEAFADLKGRAVNPLVISAVLHVLFLIDFVNLFNAPTVDYFETKVDVTRPSVLEGLTLFSIYSGCHLLGWIFACAHRDKRDFKGFYAPRPIAAQDQWLALAFFAAGLLLTVLALPDVYRGRGDDLSYQMVSRGSMLVTAASFLQPFSLSLLMSNLRRPESLWGISATALIILSMSLLGNARILILVCCLCFATAVPLARRLPAWILLVASLPSLLLLSFLRYANRESGFSSFGEFISAGGGLLNLFFGSEEISFAKSFTTVIEVGRYLPISFGSSIIAGLLYPVPRAIFPEKPYGASGIFTAFLSPDRWAQTKSESLVTGYGDLYLQFGAVGSIVAVFMISYILASVSIWIISRTATEQVLLLHFVIWSWYSFFRGDVFNTALILYPGLVIFSVFYIIRSALHGFKVGSVSEKDRYS